MEVIRLFDNVAGVSAFSTCAGFNICTYAGAAGVDSDIEALAAFTGIPRSRWCFPVQTHSVRVITPGEDSQDADGVVAKGRGVLIGVHTADCLPLLMVDTAAEVIAAVHCGWRGAVGGIAVRAVERMVALGAHPGRIVAAMGPCICPDCFEVGEEVAAQFRPSSVRRISDYPKPHVDIAAEVAAQLRSLGVESITPPPACSKCDLRLYSVRRQGRGLAQRTLSALTLV